MKVKFVPQDVEFEIAPGQSLMTFAQEKGIPIRSTCNGMPSCAECRVRVIEGESNVNPPSKKELNLIGTGYYIDQRRLSCQVQCFGDIVVDTAEQLEKVSEGPITKKYLSRVQKTSASDTHSLGGVLIEQDEALLKQIESTVAAPGAGPVHESQRPRRDQNQQGQQPRHQGHRHDNRRDQHRGGGGSGGNRHHGGQQRHSGQQQNQGRHENQSRRDQPNAAAQTQGQPAQTQSQAPAGGEGGGHRNDNRNNNPNRNRGRDRHRGGR